MSCSLLYFTLLLCSFITYFTHVYLKIITFVFIHFVCSFVLYFNVVFCTSRYTPVYSLECSCMNCYVLHVILLCTPLYAQLYVLLSKNSLKKSIKTISSSHIQNDLLSSIRLTAWHALCKVSLNAHLKEIVNFNDRFIHSCHGFG